MKKLLLPFIALVMIATTGCSKKVNPSKSAKIIYDAPKETSTSSNTTVEKTEVTKSVSKPAPAKKPTAEFPETIFVNDAAAKKSVDGRLYYDVKGHRYWKNYKDGKYYLFNKSMYKNPDFKPPKK